MIVRPETADDIEGIERVETAAFGRTDEAELIHRLRQDTTAWVLSLVADLDGRIIGHALFSRVQLKTASGVDTDIEAVGLGPIAVDPAHQRRGIGGRLIEYGHSWLKEHGWPLVFVLGHASYYPRFGYHSTEVHGIRTTWDVPPELFMVAELRPNALAGRSGTVHYHSAFNEAMTYR